MTVTPSAPGWVYILTNEAMPGLVKIGLTTRTPKERAAELSGATGVPLPFAVAWARAVPDCKYVEDIVHKMLDDKRVNNRRESFRVDVAEGRQVIEAAAGSMLGQRWLNPPQPRKAGRRTGRRKTRGDLTGFGLLASCAALVVVLALFKPALPDWLPMPVYQGFMMMERIGG